MADSPASLQSHPVLHGERVAFTGTLASMTHREAFECVERRGGAATQHVSRQTTMLVVGEEGWPLESDGEPSQKLCLVLQWQSQGVPCRVLREAEWLHLVDLDSRRSGVHNEYTPAMISRLLDIPAARLRRWHRTGLLKPARTVGRMPLFDYREVTGARRVAELLAGGVPEERLKRGLQRLRGILDADSLAQLPVVAEDARLLYRDERGFVEPETRQRRFEFTAEDPSPTNPPDGETSGEQRADDGPDVVRFEDARGGKSRSSSADDRAEWTADDWFREGCRLLEDERCSDAVEAFRLVLMNRPGDAEANFHLAEALDRLGEHAAALERCYAAVECDHEYVEAWMQLGGLHAGAGQMQSALDAFDVALTIHPNNPDVHWQKADLLWEAGRKAESVPHWEAFLRHDAESPWSEAARQRLAELTPPTAVHRPGG